MFNELVVKVPVNVTVTSPRYPCTVVITVDWNSILECGPIPAARWSLREPTRRVIITMTSPRRGGGLKDHSVDEVIFLPHTTVRYGYPRGERIADVSVQLYPDHTKSDPTDTWPKAVDGAGFFTIDQIISMVMIEISMGLDQQLRNLLMSVIVGLQTLVSLITEKLGVNEYAHMLDAAYACLINAPCGNFDNEMSVVSDLVELSEANSSIFITLTRHQTQSIGESISKLTRSRSISAGRIVKMDIRSDVSVGYVDDIPIWAVTQRHHDTSDVCVMVEVNDVLNSFTPSVKQSVIRAAELLGAQITCAKGEYFISCT